MFATPYLFERVSTSASQVFRSCALLNDIETEALKTVEMLDKIAGNIKYFG